MAVIVDLLVRGEYETVERVTRARRLTSRELADAVARYGRTLVTPRAGWWESVEITPVRAQGRVFHAAVPLWTAEEGRSDLTLELELSEIAAGVYETSVEDIHVL